MTSDGSRVEANLRVLRVVMDARGASLDEALVHVEEDVREAVRARWQAEHDQPIHRAHMLSGTGGPRFWFLDYQPEDGFHWRRHRAHLLHIGRAERDVDSIDDSSDKVLSHLEDPRAGGPDHFQVRGLVLGYVQSGKTANITALIAKAADLGYRLVVVLSGLDNGLRQQTQRRLDRELGLTGDPRGVGIPEVESERWFPLTTDDLHGDFRAGSFRPEVVLRGANRVLAVSKKNASVLTRLITFMREAPDDVPVLIVDDEADQASINTRGNRVPPAEEEDEPLAAEASEDIDPSRINGLIRELLTTFRRASYVAYTATPFANVLIDPEAHDRHVEGDLYPRDFILPLPKPPHYVGAERLFGRQAFGGEDDGRDGLDVIRIISEMDVDCLVPPRGRGAAVGFHPIMCTSLERAIEDYILAAAAKEYRLGPGPATMLIHTTQRTALHNDLRPMVEERLQELRRLWKYAPEESRPLFREHWDEDFRPGTRAISADLEVAFDEIEPLVNRFFNDLPAVTVLNMTSDDVLDFDAQPDLAAIVIGGNRLSRGLTLEHLLVSYYVRRATTYDTLMQMGRWFGYRNEYVDLTRLWTTEDLHDLFRHLSLVEEEFREQLEIYERNNLTPLDFGPRIRAHPGMAVTAARKMGTAREVQLSFAGQLRQTSRFHLHDVQWLRSNLDATRAFLAGLKLPDVESADQPEWVDVPWQVISEYLRAYQSAHGPDTFDPQTLADYIREQATRHGELVRWRVAVRGRRQPDPNLGTEELSIASSSGVSLISRSQLRTDRGSIGVLTNPAQPGGDLWQGDEEIGLSREQIERARAHHASGRFGRLGTALRMERDPEEGLLLLYPVSRYSRARANSRSRIDLFEDPESACTVIGLALVFPQSESPATVRYLAGARWEGREQFR